MLKVRTATANGTPEGFTLSPTGGPAVRSGARREQPPGSGRSLAQFHPIPYVHRCPPPRRRGQQ
jgi:hypothetical protein